jgi:hypothetical protein
MYFSKRKWDTFQEQNSRTAQNLNHWNNILISLMDIPDWNVLPLRFRRSVKKDLTHDIP